MKINENYFKVYEKTDLKIVWANDENSMQCKFYIVFLIKSIHNFMKNCNKSWNVEGGEVQILLKEEWMKNLTSKVLIWGNYKICIILFTISENCTK